MSGSLTLPVELSPRYWVPLAFVGGAVPVLFWQPLVAIVVSLFGLFLLYQAVSLRLRFTETALDIYRGQTQIRTFPYKDWQNWQIFWLPVPILFYFREVNSIHFLPMLFEARKLQACLEKVVPR
ncbi:MAG: DUF3119 family protein [Prochlorotrichaceae cyanobacterium]